MYSEHSLNIISFIHKFSNFQFMLIINIHNGSLDDDRLAIFFNNHPLFN